MTDKYLVHNLLGIEGLNIAWYGIIISYGILIGVLLATREAQRQHLKSNLIYDFFKAYKISIITTA